MAVFLEPSIFEKVRRTTGTGFGRSSAAVIYCGPDPSIGQLFRKFGKKDSLTRIKALEELRSRIESSDEINSSGLASILEPFAAHYKRSALLDPDWRCRAAMHGIVALLVQKLKKEAVAYLPEILPSLYLASLYDTHYEVCRSASAALSLMFPHENKRRMAIFDNFRDPVRKQICWLLSEECTPQELDDIFGAGASKVDARDESEERYDRALCAALTAVPRFSLAYNSKTDVDPAIASLDLTKFSLPPYRSVVRTAALARCLVPLFKDGILRSKIRNELDAQKILNLLSATIGDLTVGRSTADFIQLLAEDSDFCSELEANRKLRQAVCSTVSGGSDTVKAMPSIIAGVNKSEVLLRWSVEELMPSILKALGAPQPAPPPRVIYQVFGDCLGVMASSEEFVASYSNEIAELFMELARHYVYSGIDDALPPPSSTSKIPQVLDRSLSKLPSKLADAILEAAEKEFHVYPRFPQILVRWPRSQCVVKGLYEENLRQERWEEVKALAQMIDSVKVVEDLVVEENLPEGMWGVVYENLEEIEVEKREEVYILISDVLKSRGDFERLIDIRDRTKWPEVTTAYLDDADTDVLVEAVGICAPCQTHYSNGLVSFDSWCEKIAPTGQCENLFTTEEFCTNWGGGDIETARRVRAQVLSRAVSICLSENEEEHSFWLDVIDQIATNDPDSCNISRPTCVKALIEDGLFSSLCKVSDCWAPMASLFGVSWQDLANSSSLNQLHCIGPIKARTLLEQVGPVHDFARHEIIQAVLEVTQALGGRMNSGIEDLIEGAESYEQQEDIFAVLVELVGKDPSADWRSLVALLLGKLRNIGVDGLAESLIANPRLLQIVLKKRRGEITEETRKEILTYWSPKLCSRTRSTATDAARVVEALGEGAEIDADVVERFAHLQENDDQGGVACIWKMEGMAESCEKISQLSVVDDDTVELFMRCGKEGLDLLENAVLRMPCDAQIPEIALDGLETAASSDWVIRLLSGRQGCSEELVKSGCRRLESFEAGDVAINNKSRKLLTDGCLELWLWALHKDPDFLFESDTRSVFQEVISEISAHPMTAPINGELGRKLLKLDLVDDDLLLGWRTLTMLCMRGFEPLDENSSRWLLPQVKSVVGPILIEWEANECKEVSEVESQYTPSIRELLATKEAADGLRTELRITLPQDWPLAKAHVKVPPRFEIDREFYGHSFTTFPPK
ncbi:hypothetical protein FOL47_002800 [Perkinsus chesapeaki]|uniref:E3 ubiquitin-protein ligase listerin n=1 Tax=Perkinsus chesapeaki TaxID=330153 RepID=A0A7J6MDA0_PERCH|nr:hypothetical protein FOL47_002800 [Perkinsus chesapeaki]